MNRLESHATANTARQAAVLVLLSSGDGETSILFTERARSMRFQAGQISFPGGSRDGVESAEETAVRECFEEVGINPEQVSIQGRLPEAILRGNLFHVVPVLGRWRADIASCRPNKDEVEQIHLISVDELTDPANRCTWHFANEQAKTGKELVHSGPAFVVRDLFIWGLTADITDALLKLAGWELPWDRERFVPVPPRFLGATTGLNPK
ncbi:8-oxo-dGTP pyrophosphatase MutT (NUDIX family) [Arcanobacterium pluranimalium]|uniref:NUDIX hydrolase n=1 Tax=Arcanobacterium pluranimalium TaxID=108028 RepID=UPI0019594870|nr:CoA pyrophosphatase [Arcanobacterium pluranimalium]MBM7824265.1 8-oxo-dGTP pyrophosphatase MutT (NUDIX family) [Arcanobacterium pluranimalium]